MEIASYPDDDTPYCSCNSFEDVISSLERTTDDFFKWFSINGMKANADHGNII